LTEQIQETLKTEASILRGARYVILCFSDLLGMLKGRTLSASQVKAAFERGVGFDGSSIPGFISIEESDMVMKGDPSTLAALPTYIYNRPVAMAICDILRPTGKFYESDPRYICKRTSEGLLENGYKPAASAEVEFYLVKKENGKIEPVENHVKDHQRYFDLTPGRDLTEDYRMDFCDALSEMGIAIEREGHEVGSAQNEITFKYSTPVATSDNIMKYKFVAKALAQKKYGWTATFMPKPWTERTGSGMHVHVSLFSKNGEENKFYDPNGYAKISQTCRYFIGGLLDHARALCAIVAPTVNSYRRLVPGCEAPVYITWSRKNRSALVRVPEYFPKNGREARLEFRSPDPLCNPYLAYAVIFEAGMDGIKRKIEPGDPIERNVYNLTEAERKKLGVGTLPSSLKEALDEWNSDDICIKALGKETADKYMALKMKEWKEFEENAPKSKLEVTEWELEKYLLI